LGLKAAAVAATAVHYRADLAQKAQDSEIWQNKGGLASERFVSLPLFFRLDSRLRRA